LQVTHVAAEFLEPRDRAEQGGLVGQGALEDRGRGIPIDDAPPDELLDLVVLEHTIDEGSVRRRLHGPSSSWVVPSGH
jgi:hypothetical protein